MLIYPSDNAFYEIRSSSGGYRNSFSMVNESLE